MYPGDINLYLLHPVPSFWEQRKKVGDFQLKFFIPISVIRCTTCILTQIVKRDSLQGKKKKKRQQRGSFWDGTACRYSDSLFFKGRGVSSTWNSKEIYRSIFNWGDERRGRSLSEKNYLIMSLPPTPSCHWMSWAELDS